MIALHEDGPGKGDAVVFVHGLGADRRDWSAVVERLSTRVRCVRPDLPGQGHSARHAVPADIAGLAREVWRALDRLSGSEALTLVGHSLGGAVVLEMLRQQPQRVRAVTVCNSLPDFRPRGARAHMEFWFRLVLMRLLGPVRLARISARRMFPEARDARWRALTEERGSSNSASVYRRHLRALAQWHVERAGLSSAVPIRWLAAAGDYVSVETLRDRLRDWEHADIAVHPSAGHGLPMQDPDWVIQRLLGVCAETASV